MKNRRKSSRNQIVNNDNIFKQNEKRATSVLQSITNPFGNLSSTQVFKPVQQNSSYKRKESPTLFYIKSKRTSDSHKKIDTNKKDNECLRSSFQQLKNLIHNL
jgi:hypothetical protein